MTMRLADAPPSAPSDLSSGPFKFLDFFEKADKDSFAGRDRDIREVVARVTRARASVLFGKSGLGKTSLLKAGVFPELEARSARPIYVRTLSDPVGDLHAAVAAASGRACDSEADLRTCLGSLDDDGPVVLALDQFEEFFIRFEKQPEARARFVDAVRRLAADAELDLRIVFSLREDYVARLDDFRRALPGLSENQYRLLPLSAFGAREAIVTPLLRSGTPFAPGLTTLLVDLLKPFDYDPALLQIVCTEIYKEAKRRPGPVHLEEDDLGQVGGLEGIFERYLDGVVRDIPAEELLLTRAILDALITTDRTKQAVTIEGLAADAPFMADRREIKRVLGRFVASRLVRSVPREGEEWFELIHERLVEDVLAWLNRDLEFFSFRSARDLVVNSARYGTWRRHRGMLLDARKVDDVLGPFKGRLRFGPIETEFVLHSAIFNRAGDVAFWADRFGLAEGKDVVLGMLEDESDEVRLGAAAAAGRLEDADGRLAAACLGRALNDPSRAVRLASSLAASRLRRRARDRIEAATPSSRGWRGRLASLARRAWGSGFRADDRAVHTQAIDALIGVATWLLLLALAIGRWSIGLVRALLRLPLGAGRWSAGFVRDLKTPLTRLEYLAVLAKEGDPLADATLWQRLRARRIASRWRLKEHQEEIAARARIGLVVGLIAGEVWVATVGSALLLGYYLDVDRSTLDVVWPLVIAAGWLLGLGSLLSRGRPRDRLGSATGILWGVGLFYILLLNYDNKFEKVTAKAVEGMIYLGVSLIVLAILGPLVGWQAARTEARKVAAGRRVRWGFILFVRPILAVAALAIPSGLLIFAEKMSGYSYIYAELIIDYVLVVSLCFVIYGLPVAVYLGVSTMILRRTIGDRTGRGLAAWVLAGGVGFPFAVGAIGYMVAPLISAWEPGQAIEAAMIVSPLLTVVAAASTVAARRVPISEAEKAPGPGSRPIRWIIVFALLIALLFWLAVAYSLLAPLKKNEEPKARQPVPAPRSPSPPPEPEPRTPLERAEHFAKQGRLYEAARSYRELLANEPDSLDLRDRLKEALGKQAEYYSRQNDWHNLVLIYRDLAALEPDSPGPRTRLREALRKQADRSMNQPYFGDAAPIYRELLIEEPRSADLHAGLAEMMTRRGDLGAAVVEWRRAVELDPDRVRYRQKLAWNLCLAGRFEEALPEARAAAKAEPKDRDCLETLAHAEYGMGHWREAVDAWDKAKEVKPDSTLKPCDDDQANYAAAKSAMRKAAPP